MKIAQSTLRKVIQEEIEKVREAFTEEPERIAVDKEDLERIWVLMYELELPITPGNTETQNELEQIIAKYLVDDEEEPQGDEDHRVVDPAELTRRAQEEEKDNYIYRIMDLDPTQDEDALENMDIDELEARELLLRRRAER